jgi:hypothetical protein
MASADFDLKYGAASVCRQLALPNGISPNTVRLSPNGTAAGVSMMGSGGDGESSLSRKQLR